MRRVARALARRWRVGTEGIGAELGAGAVARGQDCLRRGGHQAPEDRPSIALSTPRREAPPASVPRQSIERMLAHAYRLQRWRQASAWRGWQPTHFHLG
jgi:hypothetical protein